MTEPISECLLMVLMVRGYEVAIRTNGDTVHITCPELPQLSVSDGTLDGALALAEVAIDAIQAGEFAKGKRTE
jgi:hypothetical protein